MRDILVSQIVLQCPSVVPVVGELEPAGVTEHVRVGGEGQCRRLARPGHELTDVAVGAQCTVTVYFKPTSTGSKSATLKVTPGGGAAVKTVALTGTGT